jgi:hypothetical protein
VAHHSAVKVKRLQSGEAAVVLSKRTIETLIDLAENKLTDIVPCDREDIREIKVLQSCVDELKCLRNGASAEAPANRGRPRKLQMVRANA